jgi:alpha-L-fucosidase
METAVIPTTQESSHVEITNEDNAHKFFRYQGIVHSEFIPQGQSINQAYYVEILKRLFEAARRKRPELWPNDWILHYDNASAHKTLPVKQFMAQKWISEMEHPPPFP